jgi:uncharacterized protein
MAALSGDSLETVQFLLNRGANVNASDKDGETPLFYAVRACNAMLKKVLIEKGANPNRKNAEGITVLDIAQEENLREISTILRGGQVRDVP